MHFGCFRRPRGVVFAVAALLSPAIASATVLKGPVIGDVTTDAVTIRWFTDQQTSGTVYYGTDPAALTSATSESAMVVDHEVRLTGLTRGTDYYYKIVSGLDTIEGTGLGFRTAVGPCAPYRFMVFGDTRGATTFCDNFTDWAKVSMMIAAQQPDFIVGTGDYVYAGAKPACWDHWFDEAGALLRIAPFFPAIGNHEYADQKYVSEVDDGLIAFARWFPLPAGPKTNVMTTYYAFSYGNARFIVFDSFKDISAGSEQLAWIESELSAAYSSPNVQHIFVVTHATFEGAGSFCLMGEQTQKNIRANVEPLVEKYGADATFVGHEHSYQRALKAGVHHVVTGGGGSPLEDFLGTLDCNTPLCFSPTYLVKYNSCTFHALSVEVSGAHVSYRTIAYDGVTVIDEWEDDRGGDKQPTCDPVGDAGAPDASNDAAQPDAAPQKDAEPPLDAGSEPQPKPDAAAPKASGDEEESGGCGCRQAGPDRGSAWTLLGVVALSALRKRRRRGAK